MSATLEVKLIDGEDNSKIYTLTEGGTTYINAGNYEEDKNKIDNDKRNGAIITKTYYIDISSDLQSGLEILSKIPGDRLSMCPNTITEVSELISGEQSDVVYRNDYKNYDNVLTPNSIASDYYRSKGRYDLVPINLSASDIIDYQICSPNMYQSAQCKGQFIYSRFRNVSDTFDMYGNIADKNSIASFKPKASFMGSENIYSFKNNNYTPIAGLSGDLKDVNDKFWIERFNFYRPNASGTAVDENKNVINDGYEKDITKIEDYQKKNLFNHIVELYDRLTGSSISPFVYFSEEDVTLYMWKKHGETEKQYAARNIITNQLPADYSDSDDITDNEDIKIVGLYYKDANGDFDIYTEETKNYTDFNGYDATSKVLSWNWKDIHTKDGKHSNGTDTFILDTDFHYTYTIDVDGGDSDDEKQTVEVKGAIQMQNSYALIKQIEVVLNRLPKTFKKSPTALKSLYADSKVQMRLNNLTNPVSLNKLSSNKISANNSLIKKNALQQSLIKANKIAARTAYDVKSVKTATMNQIEPKIQATYGFADLGKIQNLNVDGYMSMDDGSYVTTHKIGYEDNDRYRTGPRSCDSYLFLSPTNHSEIQVSGDTNKSHKLIKSNESLKVPIVYQYRMQDYNGHIFGDSRLKSTDAIVKNTKYANIIGIDIWLNTLSDTPKQYDIIIYSTYSRDTNITVGTITKKLQ